MESTPLNGQLVAAAPSKECGDSHLSKTYPRPCVVVQPTAMAADLQLGFMSKQETPDVLGSVGLDPHPVDTAVCQAPCRLPPVDSIAFPANGPTDPFGA